MKKRACVLLIIICIFAFGSCKTNAPSDAFEQTETDSIQIEDIIIPDVLAGKGVEAVLEHRRLRLVDLFGAAVLNELVKGWHTVPPS